MGFGISFGSNHTSGSGTDVVNRTESTNQQQSGTQSTQGTTTTTGNQNTQTATQTQQAQSTQNQQGTATAQQSQSTQFSEPVLSSLETTVQSLLGTMPSTPTNRTDSFNPDQFVSGGVEAASASINSDLENSLNSIFDTVGGRDDQNSMATLLANRTRGDAAAQIAGVRSNLTQTAQGIEAERFKDNLAGVGQQQGFLTQILDALKGGRAATAATGSENTQGGTSAQGTSATTGSEATQTSQTQVQDIIQQISQLLTGTTNTSGTETQHTHGSQGGFGLGLSI